MIDWIFAFFHFFLYLGLLCYAAYSLIIGNTTRFFILTGGLVLYYLLVLHKGVRSEIKRRSSLKQKREN